MSASGVTPVTATMFVLFVGFVSRVVAVLVALLVTVTGTLTTGAVSTTKKFVPPPTGNPVTVFVTVVPSGSVSTTTTFVAVEGPRFVTDIVFV
jgi:hypothetical protein